MKQLWKPLKTEDGPVSDRLRDNNFDALRLVFASMVVLFHAGLLSQAPSLHWTSYVSATFAVQAFFVVSGFLVTMSFETSSSIRSYASKRLRRILPAYVAVVIAAAVGLALLSDLSLREYFKDPGVRRYLEFNLILSNFSAPTLPGVFQNNFMPAVNGSLWTIKIELGFYCLVPLFVWASRRFGPARVMLMVFSTSILWKAGFNLLAASSHVPFYTQIAKQLPGQLCFFSGGAWAYYRTRDGNAISFPVALLGLAAYAFVPDGTLDDIVAPFAVTAIVYWAAVAGPRLPETSRYGDFSYGTYLYHFPIVQTITALGLFARSVPLASVILCLSLALVSVLSWKIIEQPLLHRRLAGNEIPVARRVPRRNEKI